MSNTVTLPFIDFQIPLNVVILGVLAGLTYALIAIGLTLVYRTSHVLNLAAGEMGALPALLMPILVINKGWPTSGQRVAPTNRRVSWNGGRGVRAGSSGVPTPEPAVSAASTDISTTVYSITRAGIPGWRVSRRPLHDDEGAEAARVEQSTGLDGSAAHGEGGQVGRAARAVHALTPSATSSSIPPAAQELRLGAHADRFGELVEGELGGDVLGARRAEVVGAALVAAVRAQPLPPRPAGELGGRGAGVVEGDDATALDAGPGHVHPGDGIVVERGAGPVRRRRRQHRRERVERRREHLGERPSGATTTNASRHDPSNTHSRIGRLSSSSLATTTPTNGRRARRGRDSTPAGCSARCDSEISTAT